METTKKLNETPLIQQMTDKHTYIIVDDQGNVSRVKDVAKEYVTETELNNFIKPYDDRIITNETDISNLETNIDSTKTDVLDLESYIDIVTPKNTASGELVHVNDALPLDTFGTKSHGQVDQETTQGYNLYNNSFAIGTNSVKISKEMIDNGIKITINELTTSSNYTGFYITLKELVQSLGLTDGESILIKYKFKTTNTSLFPPSFGYWEAGSNTKNFPSANQQYTEWTERYILTNYNANASYASFPFYSTFITVGDVYEIKDFMICRSDADKPYEPYTGAQASPNPDYQQPIEVLEGYNLLDFNVTQNEKVKVKVNNDGTISINGNGEFSLKVKPITLKANKNYYIKWELLSGTITGFDKPFQAPNLNWVVKDTFMKLNFTEDKEIKSFWINDSSVFENAVIRMWIATEEKPYLPYGCVGYKVNGKNLLDNGENYSNWGKAGWWTVENASFSTLENGFDVVSNGGNSRIVTNPSISKYKFKVGETYTLSYEVASNPTNSDIQAYYKEGSKEYYLPAIKSGKNTVNFVPKNETLTYLNIFVGTSDNVSWSVRNIQIRKYTPTSDDTYEPYQEQIVYLDLKGNWVGAINDTIKDYLVTDKKKYWLVKNVGKYVFTGDENNLVLRATYNNINQFELRNYAGFYEQYNAINIISSHYKGIAFMSNTGNSWTIDNTITIIGDGNIVIMTSQFTTVEEFKAYLKEQYNNGTPVVAYYRPKTPQIIELGELPEPIKTFEGTNNIQLLANLDTEIEVVYAQDVKKYIDSKLAEISAQII